LILGLVVIIIIVTRRPRAFVSESNRYRVTEFDVGLDEENTKREKDCKLTARDSHPLTLCVILFTLAKMMAEMNPAYKIPTNASNEVTVTTKTHSEPSFSMLKAGQVLP